MFIIFGIDTTLLATSDFHILDLKSYTWQRNYYATGVVPNTTPSTEPSSTSTNIPSTKSTTEDSVSQVPLSSETQGLSHGAVAGICVGIFALVIMKTFI